MPFSGNSVGAAWVVVSAGEGGYKDRFCFCVLVSYIVTVFFLKYFVLWCFSSLRIIFNSKTGLTAVAFLLHLFL